MRKSYRGRLRRGNDGGGISKKEFWSAPRCLSTRRGERSFAWRAKHIDGVRCCCGRGRPRSGQNQKGREPAPLTGKLLCGTRSRATGTVALPILKSKASSTAGFHALADQLRAAGASSAGFRACGFTELSSSVGLSTFRNWELESPRNAQTGCLRYGAEQARAGQVR